MLRITAALAAWGKLTPVELLGMGAVGLPEQTILDAHRRIIRLGHRHAAGGHSAWSKAIRIATWSFHLWRYFSGKPVACISAHSLSVLPVCAAISRRHHARLVYEPHELETESIACRGARRLLAKVVERALIGRCDAVLVVSDSIADWYASTYGMRRPHVIRNFTDAPTNLPTDRNGQRLGLGLRQSATVFIYQGAMMQGRGVERLLRVFECLPEFDLLLLGDGPLVPAIHEVARRCANIHHHPAVPPDDVLNYTRCADVGLCLTEPACLSYAYSLPNKLFEYLAAGLPVIVSDLPEQSRFVTRHGCGWITPAEDIPLKELLRSIANGNIALQREAAIRTASDCLWSRETERLLDIYRSLLDA